QVAQQEHFLFYIRSVHRLQAAEDDDLLIAHTDEGAGAPRADNRLYIIGNSLSSHYRIHHLLYLHLDIGSRADQWTHPQLDPDIAILHGGARGEIGTGAGTGDCPR